MLDWLQERITRRDQLAPTPHEGVTGRSGNAPSFFLGGLANLTVSILIVARPPVIPGTSIVSLARSVRISRSVAVAAFVARPPFLAT